jgi:hypothetical protein
MRINMGDSDLVTHITYIRERLDKIERKLDSTYITKQEFEPIKRIVYGMVFLVLTGVVGALVKLVMVV